MMMDAKMDLELQKRFKMNADTFRQTIEDICQKYSSVEDPGFELCLETMTYKTPNGAIPADRAEAEKRLNALQRFAEKNMMAEKDVNNAEDDLEEDIEENEDHERYTALETGIESHLGSSVFETSRVSSSVLSLPEEQDPELERTFSSQSDGPSLQDLYPGMLNQIAGAYHREQVAEAAGALRRKYRRQRWKAKHLNPGLSFTNSSVCSGATTSRAPGLPKRRPPPGTSVPRVRAHAHTHSVQHPGSSEGLRSSPQKSVNTHGPVVVMNFSTPPSSAPSSSSESSPELNQTYVVRNPPSFSRVKHYSEQQVGRQEARFMKFSPCTQSTTGLFDVGHYTQTAPSPKRRDCESSWTSPSKVDSVLNSSLHRRYNSSTHKYSSPCQQEELSPPRHFPHTQRGFQETHYSSPSKQKALWTSPVRRSATTYFPISSQQQPSPQACLRQSDLRASLRHPADTMHNSASPLHVESDVSGSAFMENYSPHKQRLLSGESFHCSPSKASPAKASSVRTSHSWLATRPSSTQQCPESYTSPSQRHQSHKNLRPSPSKQEALQTTWTSSCSLQDSRLAPAPARRLSSSIHNINQQFRQLYHKHVCQRRASSHCLCEQAAEGRSPSSRASPVTRATSAATTTNSRLAALSLTPVRRRRFLPELNPLLRRIQRLRQVQSPLVRPQHGHNQRHLCSAENRDDEEASMLSKMSEESLSPNLYRRTQTTTSSSNPGLQSVGSSFSPYSSSSLANLGLTHSHPNPHSLSHPYPHSHSHPYPRLSKRRSLSEPAESPSLKRFREGVQALSPQSKPQSSPVRSHPQPWQWGAEDEDEYEEEDDDDDDDVMAAVENDQSEESRARSIALLLQCPSPRLLTAARRLMRAGRSSRSGPGTQPHTSSWKRQLESLKAKGRTSENTWNESGMSPSASRRRLQYGVPQF